MKTFLAPLVAVASLAISVPIYAGEHPDVNFTVRILDRPTEIQGIACRDSAFLYENGKLYMCILDRAATIRRKLLPEGTVVFFNQDGVVSSLFLPNDFEIKGHLCWGGGQNWRRRISFHPNGRLNVIWLARDEEIQGVPCLAAAPPGESHGFTAYVSFHDNGKLHDCMLAKDFVIEGHPLKKGDLIRFNENGKLVESIRNGEVKLYSQP